MDCSPPGSSVHGILQARILAWAAVSSSRGSSRPRDWTPYLRLLPWRASSLPLAQPSCWLFWVVLPHPQLGGPFQTCQVTLLHSVPQWTRPPSSERESWRLSQPGWPLGCAWVLIPVSAPTWSSSLLWALPTKTRWPPCWSPGSPGVPCLGAFYSSILPRVCLFSLFKPLLTYHLKVTFSDRALWILVFVSPPWHLSLSNTQYMYFFIWFTDSVLLCCLPR